MVEELLDPQQISVGAALPAPKPRKQIMGAPRCPLQADLPEGGGILDPADQSSVTPGSGFSLPSCPFPSDLSRPSRSA